MSEAEPGVDFAPVLNSVAQLMERGFTRLDKRIDQMDRKLTTRIDNLDAKFTNRIDELDAKFTNRIDELDVKFTNRIDGLDAKVDNLGAKVDNLDTQVGLLRDDSRRMDARIETLTGRIIRDEMRSKR